MSDNKMILLGGLWLSESKNGEKYFSGNLGMNKILVFKNKNKRGESSPDYLLYIAPPIDKSKDDSKDDLPPVDVPF